MIRLHVIKDYMHRHPKSGDFGQRGGNGVNEDAIDSYITLYSELLKKEGLKLIINEDTFPGYFPEWT